MARKSLGHIELEWTCPNCGTKNPGLQKTCPACGAPQPENVQFEMGKNRDFIEDEKKLDQIQQGADIHCAFCGARNPANRATCIQCGADLKEGSQRETGRVVGAYKKIEAREVTCPHCGAKNLSTNDTCKDCGGSLEPEPVSAETPPPAPPPPSPIPQKTKKKVSPVLLIAGLLLIIVCVVIGILLTSKKESAPATVRNVEWVRTTEIEQWGPVEKEGWIDQIPANAQIGDCEKREHHVQDEPEMESGTVQVREICGTPYTIDEGTGAGEVVQDCEYHILVDFCEYTTEEWYTYNEVSLQGTDHNPAWPAPALSQEQRIGEQNELYTIYFTSDGNVYDYTTNNEVIFQQYQIGTEWVLDINALNAIVNIEPAE